MATVSCYIKAIDVCEKHGEHVIIIEKKTLFTYILR